MTTRDVAVVFLARIAEGVDAHKRFARSYLNWDPGVDHDLVVVQKGDTKDRDAQSFQAAFEGIERRTIDVPDEGFDMGAYAATANRLSNRYVVFLNTHSEIAAPNWVANLLRFARRDDVGIAAAMGSYESIRDTVRLFRHAIWASVGLGRDYDPAIAHYFDFIMRLHHPGWYGRDGRMIPPVASDALPLYRRARRTLARALRYPWFVRSGTSLIWPNADAFDYRQFPGFPNPHIRSNGFMMRRDRFLKLDIPRSPSKFYTSLLESGPRSMTRSLALEGLKSVVVDRAGNGYEVKDWPNSETFRLGSQNGLLIADNHTRAYESMSAGARATHERVTWGDFLKAAPPDFPALGVQFARSRLDS